MGFKGLTTHVLRDAFLKKHVIMKTNQATKQDIKFSQNLLLFDANALYYLVDQYIGKNKLTDEKYLNVSSLLTVSIILDIYKLTQDDNNSIPNIIGLFYDGVPPLPKFLTQLHRRSVQEKLIRIEHDNQSTIREINRRTHSSFIFMKTYVEKVINLIQCIMKMTKSDNFNLEFFISKSSIPGEGEHKIFEFIDTYKYSNTSKILIVSDDSDVPLFSTIRYPEKNMMFLRRDITNLNTADIDLSIDSKDIYEYSIKLYFSSIDNLYKDTMLNPNWGLLIDLIKHCKQLSELTNYIYKMNGIGDEDTHLGNLTMNNEMKTPETKLKSITFNMLRLDTLRGLLYGNVKTVRTPELSNYKATLLLILASYVGNDFTPERIGINRGSYYRTILKVVKGLNKLKDFNVYFNKFIYRKSSTEKYHQITDITMKQHINAFTLLSNTLTANKQNFTEITTVIQTGLKKGKNIKDPDRWVSSKLGISIENIVIEYFQSISYVTEYATLGVYGGSKTWYTILPWAPSFKTILSTVRNLKNKGLPRNYSIFNKYSTISISNKDYITDKFIDSVYDANVEFVYNVRNNNNPVPIPILSRHKSLIVSHLNNFKKQVYVPIKYSFPSSCTITILGLYRIVSVPISVLNSIDKEYKLAEIITNIDVMNAIGKPESYTNIFQLFKVADSIMNNQNEFVVQFSSVAPLENDQGIIVQIIH